MFISVISGIGGVGALLLLIVLGLSVMLIVLMYCSLRGPRLMYGGPDH